jgi:two-component system, LytTR family, sensor kinase
MDLRRAELEVLRMRLNPHFLFNTLQNISVLIGHEPDAARTMLSRLGDLLRAAFRCEAQPESSLSAEIELTQAYLEVERMRFGDRLSFSLDIDPHTDQALVPVLLLQPLVENAIKHGLRGIAQGGRIDVRSACDEQRLILTVNDNGAGIPAAGLDGIQLGVGLGSTRERLIRMYPQSHDFSIRQLEQGGTEVRVVLPFRLGRRAEARLDERISTADC